MLHRDCRVFKGWILLDDAKNYFELDLVPHILTLVLVTAENWSSPVDDVP